jgi:hypothetical protein
VRGSKAVMAIRVVAMKALPGCSSALTVNPKVLDPYCSSQAWKASVLWF